MVATMNVFLEKSDRSHTSTYNFKDYFCSNQKVDKSHTYKRGSSDYLQTAKSEDFQNLQKVFDISYDFLKSTSQCRKVAFRKT